MVTFLDYRVNLHKIRLALCPENLIVWYGNFPMKNASRPPLLSRTDSKMEKFEFSPAPEIFAVILRIKLVGFRKPLHHITILRPFGSEVEEGHLNFIEKLSIGERISRAAQWKAEMKIINEPVRVLPVETEKAFRSGIAGQKKNSVPDTHFRFFLSLSSPTRIMLRKTLKDRS